VAEMRAGMATGGSPGALVANMHGYLAGQAVADWQAVLTAVQRLDQIGVGPVGYCGTSMGCGLGIPFIAAEPRIRAAVLGLLGVHGLAEDAARITLPVQLLVQWDDQMVPRKAWHCSTPWPRLRRRCTPTPASTGMRGRSKWTTRCASSPRISADTRSQCPARWPGLVRSARGPELFRRGEGCRYGRSMVEGACLLRHRIGGDLEAGPDGAAVRAEHVHCEDR
jgi:hypothetical protein